MIQKPHHELQHAETSPYRLPNWIEDSFRSLSSTRIRAMSFPCISFLIHTLGAWAPNFNRVLLDLSISFLMLSCSRKDYPVANGMLFRPYQLLSHEFSLPGLSQAGQTLTLQQLIVYAQFKMNPYPRLSLPTMEEGASEREIRVTQALQSVTTAVHKLAIVYLVIAASSCVARYL